MTRSLYVAVCLVIALPTSGQAQSKSALYKSINKRDAETWEAALKIWQYAEPGYQEKKSSALLSKMMTKHGFKIKRMSSIPTAFVASYGAGKPVIGILGEYDALPGLSQTSAPRRQIDPKRTYGHGCGHHLFGCASASAAIAIAEQIKRGELKGTIRFYGCPAEEGGSAKVFMVLAGLFKDCDSVLHWHPGNKNTAGDRSTLARMAVKFRFHGKSAHAAGAPEQGRSALDAVELTNHAAQLLREHTPDQTRIHHVITNGGAAPNVVPEFSEVYYYVRHPKSAVVRRIYRRLVLCARGAAIATETKLEINFQGGIKEILPNNTLSQISLRNLRQLNDLKYSAEDTKFALRIQVTLDKPAGLDTIQRVYNQSGMVGMGSTDVGDVSWVVPTTGFSTACFVPGTPGHSWQVVACGASPIARKGMNLAARVLAASAWDLYRDPRIINTAKRELRQRVGSQGYRTLMQPNQKPPLDYRKPSRGAVRSKR